MRIHRFCDTIAVSFGAGPTTYLDPPMARAMADELKRFADDTDAVRFSDSKLSAVVIKMPEPEVF